MDIQKVCDCIVRGADINYQGKEGNSLLHCAVMQGNEELIGYLFKLFARKIKADVRNKEGNTPLLLAAKHQEKALSLVTLLVERATIKNLACYTADCSGALALDYLQKKGYEKEQVYKKILNARTILLGYTGENDDYDTDEDVDDED